MKKRILASAFTLGFVIFMFSCNKEAHVESLQTENVSSKEATAGKYFNFVQPSTAVDATDDRNTESCCYANFLFFQSDNDAYYQYKAPSDLYKRRIKLTVTRLDNQASVIIYTPISQNIDECTMQYIEIKSNDIVNEYFNGCIALYIFKLEVQYLSTIGWGTCSSISNGNPYSSRITLGNYYCE